ncbi:hypothetical protein CLAFUW4_11422 [Fulvia fulva]|nr:hypothetical protein CLAFUR4_11428 [Fulvia fulva]KAK4620997.1 hypothetical protein CLAFUR0_11434 [Fulvia fulva]WPV17583.1 hypothetical protein CLAFUW4_11422 [Fulvia fulva]WPV32005.1 hypothetical protein CLAFUW7_11418 [Fulvia fulva]
MAKISWPRRVKTWFRAKMHHIELQVFKRNLPSASAAEEDAADGLGLAMHGLDLSSDVSGPTDIPQSGDEGTPAESRDTPKGLLDYPAELRIIIYDLVFRAETERKILLKKACPPKKSLLLTCWQAYNKAYHIYKAQYCKYWTTNHFVVDLANYHPWDLYDIERLADRDLHRINSLTIWATKQYFPPSLCAHAQLMLWHLCGVWKREIIWVDDMRPSWRWSSENYIALRRDGFGSQRRPGWCLQRPFAAQCADVLRHEVRPMTLKEQLVTIMQELHRETVRDDGWLG